jgi:hypothetical protein
MKLSKTARAILSVTAIAWSIPFAQASGERLDADDTLSIRQVEEPSGAPEDPIAAVVLWTKETDGRADR